MEQNKTQQQPPDFSQRYPKHVEEKTAALTNVSGKTWIIVCRKLKLDPHLSLCTNSNSQ
jgi:hypothetical protein